MTEIAMQSIRNVGVSGVGLWRTTVESMKRRAVVSQFSTDGPTELSRGTGGRC
jgi:hypothetical protein